MIQQSLPFPPVRMPIPISLRSTSIQPSQHLSPLGTTDPGAITGMVAGYLANFECNEILHRHLEAFHVVEKKGLEAKTYHELDAHVRPRAAMAAMADLYLCDCVHGDVLDWDMVADPVYYQAFAFTFAQARIVMDARVLNDLDTLVYEIDERASDDRKVEVRPCVIEVFGAEDPRVRRAVAEDHLNQAIALLPERLRPQRNFGRLVMWD